MELEKEFKSLQNKVNSILNEYCDTISNTQMANIIMYSFNGFNEVYAFN